MIRPRAPLFSLAFVSLLAVAGCLHSPLLAVPQAPRELTDPNRLHLLIINGGGRPSINYQSHLLHVRQLLSIADQSGIPRDQIAIFSSDGDDPGEDLAVRAGAGKDALWRLYGTPLYGALRPVRFTSSQVDGATLNPATEQALTEWFGGPAQTLGDGDTLLLYVTDHGERNDENPADNTITLWGADEALSVSELRALLARLDPGVRVVTLMSQCFSGSFAGIRDARSSVEAAPDGSICGYFASTRNRPAYGCYPENLGRENVGHSFRFFQGLTESGSFPAAHEHTLVTDATPDVPLRTSDLYLRERLRAAAQTRGVRVRELADEQLVAAWGDRGRWEPQIRRMDRIGEAFGFFSPRSLAELGEQRRRLPEISAHLQRVSLAWKAALADANRAHLQRLLDTRPEWKERLAAEKLRALDVDQLEALGAELIAALETTTNEDAEATAQLASLRRRGEDAAAAAYRMEVRYAAVLRLRMILFEIAGLAWLAEHGSDAERATHAELLACEDAIQLPAGIELDALDDPETFPPFDEDVARATAALPAWMGIRFRNVTEAVREAQNLAAGAARVLTVYPDSPAEAAGLQAGDIILGPPGEPFEQFREVRAWTMLSEIGRERPLAIVREEQPLEVRLVPGAYPLAWPSLPGPPEVGSKAPALDVLPYRGDPKVVAGKPHLVFFWATWCFPCKMAVPSLVEFEKETGVPVVAVTDEPRESLDPFFAQTEEFPGIVAIDRFRQTHQAYGVSGTPTFVLVDGDGTVRHLSTGFSAEKGLQLPDGIGATAD